MGRISPKTSKTTVKAGPPEGQKKQTQEVDPDKPFEIRYKPSKCPSDPVLLYMH